VWFALTDDRPLCAFAGIWTEFVEPIRPTAMPVILTTDEEPCGARMKAES
jgi:putative SOS response-associated peptidase YedK